MRLPTFYTCKQCENKYPDTDYNIEEELCHDCLKVNQAASSSLLSDGLSCVAEKFKLYFCKKYSCSDMDNNQYPKCKVERCQWRDTNVDELMDIIREAR